MALSQAWLSEQPTMKSLTCRPWEDIMEEGQFMQAVKEILRNNSLESQASVDFDEITEHLLQGKQVSNEERAELRDKLDKFAI